MSAETNILQQVKDFSGFLKAPDMQFVPAFYKKQVAAEQPYSQRSSDWVLQNEIMAPFLPKIAAGLHQAGAKLLAGSDATNPVQIPGISLQNELQELVTAGLSPYETLVAATRNPAQFLARKDSGTIHVGSRADLVLLKGNPLQSIQSTRTIAGVSVNGRWLDEKEIAAIKQRVAAHFAHE